MPIRNSISIESSCQESVLAICTCISFISSHDYTLFHLNGVFWDPKEMNLSFSTRSYIGVNTGKGNLGFSGLQRMCCNFYL